MASRALSSRAVFSRAVFSRAVFSRAVASRAMASRAVASRAVASRAVFSRAVGSSRDGCRSAPGVTLPVISGMPSAMPALGPSAPLTAAGSSEVSGVGALTSVRDS
ncbi:pentapeptide repeat-containing protein [Microbispora bryophytorum]|uniref:pentapeptide repeat-containing protein n=1 Tax=Microbispora bryophytorum TaxID=1460882 RepID=UPI003711CC9B